MLAPEELKEGIDDLITCAWELLLLERSITSGHASDEEKQRYRSRSLALFGRVRADRAALPAINQEPKP